MEVSTLDLYIASGTSVFLIIGSLISIVSLSSRRLARSIEQTNIRIDRTETRLTDSIDEVKISLNGRIDEVKTSLNGRIDEVKTSLNGRIDEVKTSLNGRIDEVKTSLNRVEARLTASIEKVEAEQKIMNAQVADMSRKVYILNGQVQGLVVHVRGREGILMQEEVQPSPTPPISTQ